jgi:hypothetical protein
MAHKHILEFISVAIGLAGTIVSILGTYFPTRFYHPFSPLGFLRTIAAWTGWFIRFDFASVEKHAVITSRLGEVTPERRAQSLIGIYWIFVGFALQAVSLLVLLVHLAMQKD